MTTGTIKLTFQLVSQLPTALLKPYGSSRLCLPRHWCHMLSLTHTWAFSNLCNAQHRHQAIGNLWNGQHRHQAIRTASSSQPVMLPTTLHTYSLTGQAHSLSHPATPFSLHGLCLASLLRLLCLLLLLSLPSCKMDKLFFKQHSSLSLAVCVALQIP